jgi:hypothetical protein
MNQPVPPLQDDVSGPSAADLKFPQRLLRVRAGALSFPKFV